MTFEAGGPGQSEDLERLYDEELTTLYDQFGDQVYRCARRGLRHEDAEEIVNSAFLAARRQWQRVREMAFPVAYVAGAAANLRATALRQAARNPVVSLDDPSTPEPWRKGASAAEEVWQVREALKHLSPREEQVTILYYWTGLPTKDIAEALQVSVGHVSRTLSDARARLEPLLSDDGDPANPGGLA